MKLQMPATRPRVLNAFWSGSPLCCDVRMWYRHHTERTLLCFSHDFQREQARGLKRPLVFSSRPCEHISGATTQVVERALTSRCSTPLG